MLRSVRSRVLAAVGAVLIVGGTVIAAMAADGSDSGASAKRQAPGVFVPELGIRLPKEKARAAARSFPPDATPEPNPSPQHQQGPPGSPHQSIQPARISQHPQGFFSTSVIWPLVNEWSAASHRTYTAVDAGVDAADRSVGVFGIYRQDFVQVTQEENFVKVAGAGALEITQAPLGPKVVGWAQKRGELQFTSKNGITGTLHLKDDTVTVNP
jgi:hypothetical protein